ncbi:MAG: protein BatD [Desulfobacterales bacterium]|nr:protein BatD [Desulfobacterales bacterium]
MAKIVRLIAFACISATALFITRAALAAPIKANVAVERTDVFVGEPFIFQIQVEGSENPARPDMSGLKDFTVEYKGGRQNSSTSISIVNGRMTKNIKRGYVFSYSLLPQRAGGFTIPSMAVHAEGQTVYTTPVTISVQKPMESDDIRLQLHLSKSRCYVGEPITLTVTWYLGSDVKGFNFSFPFLRNTDKFHFFDPEIDTSSGKGYYRIPIEGREVIGEKGRSSLDGKNYATITFIKVLIPKQAEKIKIGPATVTCDVLAGYRRQRNQYNDFFSDFFNDDFFGRRRRGVYKKFVAPSNSIDLQVSQVPSEGRPPGFAGHVGVYKIQAHAQPTVISVGDPITLKVTLSGPDYLDHIKLPPLEKQAKLSRDFKIPRERAPGETSGKTRVFTQTIRALSPDVKEIPPIELSYFDTRTGRYQIARTRPIPLNVKNARVVTALDAEGTAAPVSASSEVETWAKGIAHNFEDPGVLETQLNDPLLWFSSPAGKLLIVIPHVLYLFLFSGMYIVRRKNADPGAARAKKAGAILIKAIKDTRKTGPARDIILKAFRTYLGDKLAMPSGAITFKDVDSRLKEKGVGRKTLDTLQDLFRQYEADRYAGNSGAADPGSVLKQSLVLAHKLERKLR